MRSLTIRTTAALTIAAAATLALTTPAAAASLRSTTFYTTADYTGASQTVAHNGCDGQVMSLRARFRSVDNRPAPGCKVQVYANASPTWQTLCVGRSTLGTLLGSPTDVRAVPGSAPACLGRPR